ncbi:beta-carotene 15,15'-monooxygenase [Psychrobacillus antarcticus]|uniref:beta-carotene 15,15'-monooxygenase n=1 Tax=Psychrobacillus antarcticus TaxID=2879115 RepID=UPI0024086F17|nr:beta-carotene 15,15'-monooxygenase [Psychrobacillus antarcticus]
MVYRKTKYANIAIALLFLVLSTNFIIYQSSVQDYLSLQLNTGAVVGSLIDFAIIAPLLMYAAFKLSIKQTIGITVASLIIARILIPNELFAPFTGILYAGIVIEILLIVAEIALIFLVIWKIPKIRFNMKEMNEGALYSLLPSVEKVVTKNILIRIVMSEFLMIYYAFFTWKKKAPNHEGVVTMHKKTSAIAFHMMIIHSILIETIGIHWWLHDKSLVLSIVLLIFNIYSLFFFMAEIQIMKLHPLEIKNGKLYISRGLTSRIVMPLQGIKEIKWDIKASNKNTILFAYKDFESVEPQAVIYLSRPVEATMFMGAKKSITEFAIRVDEPEKLKLILLNEGER